MAKAVGRLAKHKREAVKESGMQEHVSLVGTSPSLQVGPG